MQCIEKWLNDATVQLKTADIATARLDCLVLLEDEIGMDRSWVLAHPEHELQIEQIKNLNKKIVQRAKHIPLAYIRGKTEFYGREFIIDQHVLEPRPESETIITMLKQLSLPPRPTIVDVGTGSGMLAITAKLELPDARVVAIDIDKNCLVVAEQNARKHEVDITVHKGDLVQPLLRSNKEFPGLVLLCNLPYVPDDFHINTAAMHEPAIAIFGGPDGLDLYRQLFGQLTTLPELQPIFVLTESLPPQHDLLSDIVAMAGYRRRAEDDFIQIFEPGPQ
jgi:release factor glutamine methyltransferase